MQTFKQPFDPSPEPLRSQSRPVKVCCATFRTLSPSRGRLERIVRHQAARHAQRSLSFTTNRQPVAAARRASIQRCWARVRPSGITKPGLLITFTQPSICWRRIIVRAARSQARISASVIRLGGTFSSRWSRRPLSAFQPIRCTPLCSVARRGPNVNSLYPSFTHTSQKRSMSAPQGRTPHLSLPST